jgi:hypothetical protein
MRDDGKEGIDAGDLGGVTLAFYRAHRGAQQRHSCGRRRTDSVCS